MKNSRGVQRSMVGIGKVFEFGNSTFRSEENSVLRDCNDHERKVKRMGANNPVWKNRTRDSRRLMKPLHHHQRPPKGVGKKDHGQYATEGKTAGDLCRTLHHLESFQHTGHHRKGGGEEG